jgi:2-dehydro-3-deoxygalactonokinase
LYNAGTPAEWRMTKPVVAIDWGTSSLRGVRLDATGGVIDERASLQGILNVPAGGFEAVFKAQFGDWLGSEPNTLCLISGMAGSRQGWREAPYCQCPSGASDIAAALAWVERGRIAIVPGLSCERDGAPDVMRGEETQIFGALDMLDLADALFVLPGTHSKWAEVRAGRVERFSTAMTGEVYALLRRHSILARTLPQEEGMLNGAAFDAGVERAMRSVSLLQSAFTARTLALFERSTPDELASYLSGLVIGEELRAQGTLVGRRVHIIGSEALTQRYERALATVGAEPVAVGAQATWRGLWNIAHSLEERLQDGLQKGPPR